MNRREILSAGVVVAATVLPAMALPIFQEKSDYHRLSVEKDDPGYLPYIKSIEDRGYCTVYLNGVKQEYVVTADAYEGWIERIHFVDGVIVPSSANGIPTEIAHGKVEIRFS